MELKLETLEREKGRESVEEGAWSGEFVIGGRGREGGKDRTLEKEGVKETMEMRVREWKSDINTVRLLVFLLMMMMPQNQINNTDKRFCFFFFLAWEIFVCSFSLS